MTDTRPDVPLEDAITYQQARLKDRASKGIPSKTDEAILASLLELQQIHKMAKLEGVAPEMIASVLRGELHLAKQRIRTTERPEPVERYTHEGHVSPTGAVVAYDDYADLLDAYDRMRAEFEQFKIDGGN